MKFEIDVSGADIFHENYTICISNDQEIIKGFKFNKKLIDELKTNWSNNKYRYGCSESQRGFFKVRLYCIVIYYLFEAIKKDISDNLDLIICRDFPRHFNDINQSLKYFIEGLLKIKINPINYSKLDKNSTAHWYAYLMSKDKKNKLNTYINISLLDIEKHLKKSKYPKGQRPHP